MKFTVKSFERFFKFNKDVNIALIANTSNHLGFEVESITDPSEYLKDFTICHVVEAKKHERSDKISVCKVFDGKKELSIICGAPNAKTGIYAVLASVGTTIPSNGLVIKEKHLAGVLSQGMLCSGEELCLSPDGHGIIEIPSEIGSQNIGISYANYANVGTTTVELAITPNRGDAMSLLGLSREFSALNLGKIIHTSQKLSCKTLLDVIISKEAELYVPSIIFVKCKNFNTTLASIEQTIKDGGFAINLPAVNSTNFAAYAFGQPMHAYDAEKIKGTIRIDISKGTEEFLPIVGEKITIKTGAIIICDDEKVLSLAGIMGDSRSQVDGNTQNIILEAGIFDKSLIFKASHAMQIKSYSSFLFERSACDAEMQEDVMSNILTIGERSPDAMFIIHKKYNQIAISFEAGTISRRIGINYTDEQISTALSAFGFTTINGEIIVPSYRSDVSNIDDLSEEVVRFYGYDVIPCNALEASQYILPNNTFAMKSFLARQLMECITYSFSSFKFAKFLSEKAPIALQNPISPELAFMRTSVLGTLLLNCGENYAHGVKDQAIFEIGTVFNDNESLELGIVRIGNTTQKSILENAKHTDIFTVKADAILFLERFYGLREESITFEKLTHEFLHPHQSFTMCLGKMKIGILAQIHPEFLEDINTPIFVCSINLNSLPQKKVKSTIKTGFIDYKMMDIKRDISIIIDEKITIADIMIILKKCNLPVYTSCIPVDLYRGSQIDDGKKSIMLDITIKQLRAISKEIIDEIILCIETALKTSIGAVIREC